MKVGFTCGAFDLCHYGHILMFEECRAQCDYLIVGIQTDPSIDRPHKNRPVQGLVERLGQVRALKAVDSVVIYATEEDLYNYLSACPPDIRFIGADWEGKPFTGHDLKIKVVYNSRNHSFSSSELRQRIAAAEALRNPAPEKTPL